ncbi:patatin-like phospholipase family protein [Oceanibacterium hippocampi]|uniref:Patatin-like phospholipase n=1 Tax=Oceanibacterium hippocampi TaxID=745714 RepID=A0A1Y5TUW8_9PROT|nr:patatin-like phospholipase family protein [Oceanibacterium hippocampi]SLN73676.1 Patatin-like phospholipase [Oceanibacterium hippocampi]
MAKTARILSIDGGGIRGIIPALVLKKLEGQLGHGIAESFHMIAGTSTGALIAAGLSRPRPEPLSANELARLYVEDGPKIFQRSLWHGVSSLGGLTDQRYDAAPLERILDMTFGNTLMSEAATDLLVPAYEIERSSGGRREKGPHFFKSWHARGHRNEKPDSHDFYVRDVVRASTAAPTYFEAADILDRAGDERYLIDGGVVANNPALCALASARRLYPAADSFLLVSLGTGDLGRPIEFDAARHWGISGWARPLLSVIFGGGSESVDYQLGQLLTPGRSFFRFQTDLLPFADGLQGPNDDFDDASPDNLLKLQRKATELVEARADDIVALVKLLQSDMAPREALTGEDRPAAPPRPAARPEPRPVSATPSVPPQARPPIVELDEEDGGKADTAPGEPAAPAEAVAGPAEGDVGRPNEAGDDAPGGVGAPSTQVTMDPAQPATPDDTAEGPDEDTASADTGGGDPAGPQG